MLKTDLHLNPTENIQHRPLYIYRPIASVIMQAAHRFCSKIASMIKKLRFDIWIIAGERGESDPSLRILYSGTIENRSYLAKLVFGEAYDEQYMGRFWFWHIILLLLHKNGGCDGFFFETRKSFCRFLNKKHHFIIPDWINTEIDLSLDMDTRAKFCKTTKCNIKRIRKNNWQFEISRKISDFDHFYYNMYMPYVEKRYQNMALVRKYDDMQTSFKNGELLLIRDNNEYVAGSLIDYKMMNGIPRLTQLGVLNGHQAYVAKGAISAIYYYAIEYLKKQGHSKIYFGWTRSFLKDGVLNYKKSWGGCRVSLESGRVLILKPYALNSAIKSFLVNNPFITIHRNQPIGVVFLDEDQTGRRIKFDSLKQKYSLDGLSEFVLYTFSRGNIQRLQTD